jgi:hypothetical protein
MLYLTYKVAKMLHYAVEQAKGKEVGGLAKTHLFGNGAGVLLQDIIIPPQLVTGGTTKISPDALMGLVEELAKRKEVCTDWRCWWHVHPFGAVKPVPSSVDNETLDSLAEELGWAVGLIVGKEDRYHGWLSLCQPWDMRVEIEVSVFDQDMPNLRTKVEKMMKDVEVEKPAAFVNMQRHGKDIRVPLEQWLKDGAKGAEGAGDQQHLPGYLDPDVLDASQWPYGMEGP